MTQCSTSSNVAFVSPLAVRYRTGALLTGSAAICRTTSQGSSLVSVPCHLENQACRMNLNNISMPTFSAPPETVHLDRLRAIYKAAKCAYKEYKCNEPPDSSKLLELEMAYKLAKAEYKSQKAQMKMKQEKKSLTLDSGAARVEADEEGGHIQVCGGKMCMSMGSGVVAQMLLGKSGAPNAGCMKKCGGSGPTVAVKGQIVKVDIRGAVASAVDGVEAKDTAAGLHKAC